MADKERVMTLIIEAHPAARTTHEVVHQLTEILPIESRDDFLKRARVSVAGEELVVADLEPWLTEELFPVHDEADLVEKVAGIVRISGHILSRSKPKNPSAAHARLIEELSASGPQVGVGAFRGPSLFKVTPDKRS